MYTEISKSGSKEIHYLHIGGGRIEEKRSHSFEYITIPKLPNASTNGEIFREAIAKCKDSQLEDVLTDLYRYLVFSNFAHPHKSAHNNRDSTFKELDQEYPYSSAIQRAENFAAGKHPSGKTDTLGAVLHLMLYSKNSETVNRLLGEVLVAMLNHRKFKKVDRILPKVDVG